MSTRFWAVVPAAGHGSRMGGPVPKQYLPLNGRPVIVHTVERLAAHPRIAGLVVALALEDPHWERLALRAEVALEKPLWTAPGGAERCHSVLNGLRVLAGHAAADDWVLVHDAARPCVRPEDLDRLMDALATHPCGGLLGLPVKDTMKRVDAAGAVRETVDRTDLWHALTPQMFRLAALRAALEDALAADVQVTDEASAMERIGCRPQMVAGHADNLKITRPEDLDLARLYLTRQLEGGR